MLNILGCNCTKCVLKIFAIFKSKAHIYRTEAAEQPHKVVHACELGRSKVKRKSQPKPQKQVQGHALPLLCSVMAQSWSL